MANKVRFKMPVEVGQVTYYQGAEVTLDDALVDKLLARNLVEFIDYATEDPPVQEKPETATKKTSRPKSHTA